MRETHTSEIGARNRPENFWYNTEKIDTNPILILAEILAERGSDVLILDNATTSYGERLTSHVAIQATPEGARLLNKILDTPENRALCHTILTRTEPDVGSCQWDEETKRRVLAFYWTDQARFLEEYANGIDPVAAIDVKRAKKNIKDYWIARAQEHKVKAQELLGSLEPLTPDDIRALIGEVVDRVLAQPAEST